MNKVNRETRGDKKEGVRGNLETKQEDRVRAVNAIKKGGKMYLRG